MNTPQQEKAIYSYIEIKSFENGSVVKRLNVTGKTVRSQRTIESGMNRNLNHSEYYTFSYDSRDLLIEI